LFETICSAFGRWTSEEHPQQRAGPWRPVNISQWRYPMTDMRAALERLAAADSGDASEGVILEYINRRAGDADDGMPYPTAAPR
jgi:gentisate 1,2-dioxygenase